MEQSDAEVHTGTHSTYETKGWKPGIQGELWLQNSSEDSLGYMRPCLINKMDFQNWKGKQGSGGTCLKSQHLEEEDPSLSSRQACSLAWVPGQPELHRETMSQVPLPHPLKNTEKGREESRMEGNTRASKNIQEEQIYNEILTVIYFLRHVHVR